MRVNVRLFAMARDRAGLSELALDLPEGASVSAAVDALGRRLPSLGSSLGRVAFAVNQAYALPATVLKDGDELAVIPPVSGG